MFSTHQVKQNNVSTQNTVDALSIKNFTEQNVYVNGLQNFNIQRKLTVGAVDDPLEHEADAMADKVMRMPEQNFIQRKCSQCEEEEKAQRKPLESFIQRKQAQANTTVSNAITNQLQSTQDGGSAMPETTKSFMESRFGTNFSNVNIHTDNNAAQLSNQLNAQAFTFGNDIYFNEGKYQPESSNGKHLLAHELTHVLQQNKNNSIARSIMRQTAPPGKSKSIDDADGKKYIINRDYKVITAEQEKYLPPDAKFDADAKNIYLEITWCKDTRGNIKIGANIPQQATDLLKRIATSIANNGNSQAVRNEVEKTDLTPFVNLEVARSGSWKFSVQTNVTVDSSGFKGAGGSVTIDTGSIKITGSVSGSKDQGVTGSVGVEIPLGSTPEFKCKTEKIKAKIKPTDTCKLVTPAHFAPPVSIPVTDEKSTYIYFEYAKKVIEQQKTKPELEKLKELIKNNYSIKKITGYTSPEGLKRPVKGFEGNDTLSEERVEAAFDKATDLCSEVQKENPEINCSGITIDVEEIPASELYSLTREVKGKAEEVEGDELIKSADDQFLKSPEEDRFTNDPDFKVKLDHAKTLKQKAALIYPLLRRAKVILQKTTIKVSTDDKVISEIQQDIDCASIPKYINVKADWDLNDNLNT